jgi:hypothetical protein
VPEPDNESSEPPRPFAHLSTGLLVARINRAHDFGYDDESDGLNRRLRATSPSWRWTQTDPPRVELYQRPSG